MNMLPRWMRPGHAPRIEPPPEPDPGDMGTAFGLDASFGPAQAAPSHAAPHRPEDDPRWRQRLARRPER